MTEEPLPYNVVPFKKKSRDFIFTTSAQFWKREDLNAKEKSIPHIIMAYQNRHGDSWPSKPTIARKAGMGRQSFDKALNKLREKGVIDWRHERDRKTGVLHNIYRVYILREKAENKVQEAL